MFEKREENMKFTQQVVIYILSIASLVLSGCGPYYYQLKGPTAENPKPGAVSMCFYYREKRDAGNMFVNLQRINIVEKKGNGKYVNIPYVDNSNTLTSAKIKEMLSLGHGYCYLHTGLKSETQYSIDSVVANYVAEQMRHEVNISLDPENTYQHIPIKVNPGKIKFLGVFMFDAVATKKGEKAIQIVDGNNESLKTFSQGRNNIYGDYEASNKGAEINQLKALQMVISKEDYWYGIAEKRLRELGVN